MYLILWLVLLWSFYLPGLLDALVVFFGLQPHGNSLSESRNALDSSLAGSSAIRALSDGLIALRRKKNKQTNKYCNLLMYLANMVLAHFTKVSHPQDQNHTITNTFLGSMHSLAALSTNKLTTCIFTVITDWYPVTLQSANRSAPRVEIFQLNFQNGLCSSLRGLLLSMGAILFQFVRIKLDWNHFNYYQFL